MLALGRIYSKYSILSKTVHIVRLVNNQSGHVAAFASLCNDKNYQSIDRVVLLTGASESKPKCRRCALIRVKSGLPSWNHLLKQAQRYNE